MYRETGVLTGLKHKQRSDKGVTQISAEVEQIIQQVLEVDYLNIQRKSAQKIITEISRRCHEQNLPECAVKPHPLGWGYQARTAKSSNQC